MGYGYDKQRGMRGEKLLGLYDLRVLVSCYYCYYYYYHHHH